MEEEFTPITKSYRLLYPRFTILVTTGTISDPNVLAIAWGFPLSGDPPLYGIQLTDKRYSAKLIDKYKEFCINVPGPELIEASYIVGSISGKELRPLEKFQKAKLTPIPSKIIKAPHIKECNAFIECKLVQKIETGDHWLYIGKAVYSSVKKGCTDSYGLIPGKSLYWRDAHKEDPYKVVPLKNQKD